MENISVSSGSANGEQQALLSKSRTSRRMKFCTFVNVYKAVLLALLLVIAVSLVVFISRSEDTSSGAASQRKPKTSKSRIITSGNDADKNTVWPLNTLDGSQLTGKQLYLYNVGRNAEGAKAVQDCYGPYLKQSFPDLDYALFGYNILQGYPLAIGHDPGFTLPIFKADYSKGHFTSDCRYSVPHGLTVVPDVSCITSFSSTVVQNSYEFSKSLSVSAHVSGGGWGVQFSASTGYKQSSSVMASGESLFIISEAKCNYYFSKLNSVHLPPLDDDFVEFLKVLEVGDDEETYINFFKSYGTHFASYVIFGARYINQHTMSVSSYQSQQESGVDVAAQASYSGIFSLGGGFNMDSSQREAASSFQQSVTTTTITVGAPPPSDGEAMTWASTVKDSPVPTQYKLESIENLFTEKFMSEYDIDFDRIRLNIITYKEKYCLALLENGDVDSCASMTPGLRLKKSSIQAHIFGTFYAGVSEETCINLCMRDPFCRYIDYNNGCWASHIDLINYVVNQQNDVIIFPTKIRMISADFTLINTSVDPDVPTRDNNQGLKEKAENTTQCRQACLADHICFAFMFCSSCLGTGRCILYTEENLKTLDTPLKPASNEYSTVIVHRDPTEKIAQTSPKP